MTKSQRKTVENLIQHNKYNDIMPDGRLIRQGSENHVLDKSAILLDLLNKLLLVDDRDFYEIAKYNLTSKNILDKLTELKLLIDDWIEIFHNKDYDNWR